MTKPTYKPGQKIPNSGIYKMVGPRGGEIGENITAVKGHKFPPTQRPGEVYKETKKTNP